MFYHHSAAAAIETRKFIAKTGPCPSFVTLSEAAPEAVVVAVVAVDDEIAALPLLVLVPLLSVALALVAIAPIRMSKSMAGEQR